MRALIRRSWLAWSRWRYERRVCRAYPSVAEARKAAAETARRKINASRRRKELTALVHANLEREKSR
jgi:hypothetical protein